MFTTGPNPVVYFDIAADNQPLGRVTFEVRMKLLPMNGTLGDRRADTGWYF